MRRQPPGWMEASLWSLCAAALLVSFAWPLSALPHESFCWFYALTHLPCPGCGLTRAFISISHAQWAQAWSLNPFSFIWYPLAVYGFLRPVLLRKLPSTSQPLEALLQREAFFPSLVICMFLVWTCMIAFNAG